eukprot:Hpha_TRINITY_DN13465_c0_g2::TRINITY_DN13465_c0_g2_i1::g.130825::m.130825/K00798/MMAB, pduO; cob(I)alamin adenosyltransferase
MLTAGRVFVPGALASAAALAACASRRCVTRGRRFQSARAPAKLPPQIEELHRTACEAGDETYTDPSTGFTVFTRVAHMRRGHCCGSGCRHCPYEHFNTPANRAERERHAAEEEGREAKARAKASVYTRTGDKGTSQLFTGERRGKDDLVFEALGAVDELSANIGVAREYLMLQGAGDTAERLEDVQRRLLDVGSHVATPRDSGSERKLTLTSFGGDHVRMLEDWIDAVNVKLPPLRAFILPTGGLASCHLHVCRTVCRRAERSMVRLNGAQHVEDPVLKYMNRLSDLLFMLAREAAARDGRSDVLRPKRPGAR